MGNFVRNLWYVAGWCDDFAGRPVARTIIGDPVVLYRRSDGELVALADRCVHRMAPLSLGRVEGDELRCMYHGLRFASDGRCTQIPGQDMIPDQARLRVYPVVEKNSWVWVWMGDPERADAARIPDPKALDDPAWVLRTGSMTYAANYELINDNLLDLAHLAFVHATSFGADEVWSQIPAKIEKLPEGVRSSRWITNTRPIPPLGEAARHDLVDIWTSYDFLMPGIFLLYTSIHPVGTAAACGGQAPATPGLFDNFTSQAVTPVGDRASVYYYSWGPRAGHGDGAMAQAMVDIASGAFEEDRTMIEAQQRIIDGDLSARPMPVAADKGITLFHRMMATQDR